MTILDLFYDLLHLEIPAVCDSYDAAMKSMCKYRYHIDSFYRIASLDPIWNLTTIEEGYTFVASEGVAKLPRLSYTR